MLLLGHNGIAEHPAAHVPPRLTRSRIVVHPAAAEDDEAAARGQFLYNRSRLFFHA